MLYLNPPFQIIRGVSIFPDHADPLQFYFLPAAPHLTMIEDPATGTRIPQFQLLRYAGDAGTGGFLNFTVDLGVDPALLDEIGLEIKALFGLEAFPRLAPALLDDGSVRLMILGADSGDDADDDADDASAGDAGAAPRFVRTIEHAAKPALYGDNQAIFSVELDDEGVQLVEASLDGAMMPIGIVYSLSFTALRPAYNVRITADWDRVYEHLQDRTSSRTLFFTNEVDEIVDELIEERLIEVQVDSFLGEDDDATTVTNPTQWINDVKDMILDTFFEPSLNPISSEKDGWDRFNDTTNRLHTLAVTGGWAAIAAVEKKKVDLTRIDRKRFDFNLSERTTVRRSIYPQAHLEGLTRVLRDADGALTRSDLVREVTLNDAFFTRREIEVVNRADFEHDGIASIHVQLRYGDDRASVLLDADGRATRSWTSRLENGALVRPVEASYTVTFTSRDSAERPVQLEAPPRLIEGGVFQVNPRADGLYHIQDVPVLAADNFPWDRYSSIRVELRYEDAAHDIQQHDVIQLTETSASSRWAQFLRDPERTDFEHRLTFFTTDNRTWSTPWTPTLEQEVLVVDPRPDKLEVQVVPLVSWDFVSMIFVDVRYEDPENGVRKEETFVFDNAGQGSGPKTFRVHLQNPDHRLVHYTAKLLLSDHTTLLEQPPSATRGKQIFIRPDLRGHRVVTVQPEAADFTALNLREVKVDLSYEDQDNGLSFASSLTFTSPEEMQFFEYDYVQASHRSYTADVTKIFNNGFTADLPPKREDRDVLVIDL